MIERWLIIALACLVPCLASADDLEEQARADLAQSLEQLSAQRETIAAEKATLLARYNELEARVRQQRREWDMLKLTAGAQGARYDEQRRQLEQLELQYGALQAALADYLAELQTNLHSAELTDFQERVGSMDGQVNPQQARELLDYGLTRLSDANGGRVLPGDIIGPTGEVLAGKFFLWGPMQYFHSDWSSQAGFAADANGLLPRLEPFTDAASSNELKQAIEGEQATLPVDPSNGRALRLTQESESIGDHIRSGGVWAWPILGLAALAILVAVYKFAEIIQVRFPADQEFDEALAELRAGKIAAVRARMAQWREPSRTVLTEALERLNQPREVLEDHMLEYVIRWQMRWERGLAVLAVTAAVSPLLGLLGTVTGMIATFRLIGVYGSGDARPLSGGISEALVTTELGLIVAIPALIVHAFLSRKTQSLTSDLESIATRFIDEMPRKETPSDG